VVPESKDPNVSGRPDILGAGFLAAAVGLVALALVKAPEWGWGSASFLGLLAASVVCGAAMVYRSRRHHSPVIELELLRSRTFPRLVRRVDPVLRRVRRVRAQLGGFLTGVWRAPRWRPGWPSRRGR
jgi:hypothetical protein